MVEVTHSLGVPWGSVGVMEGGVSAMSRRNLED